ncbi:MAG: FAD-dependent oxidoreductase [Elusimicrobia bacterium]|nr:FAD-dependent oxidoreductase [Elusimicrobiota bacterium]
MANDIVWETAIVGGGPAGLAAGLHLARAGYRVLLTEQGRLGGQARRLGRIENYPGFPSGIDGRRLMDRWVRQARRWGLRTRRAEVRRVRRDGRGFSLRLDGGRSLTAGTVVYCPGAVFRGLGLPGEKRLWGRGLFHAALDQAPLWRGRTVAVAGGGEAAAHQALALARHARRVYLLCRGPKLKAHRLLLRRLSGQPRIVRMHGVRVRGLSGGRRLRALDLSVPRGRLRLPVDALFVLVGKNPAPLPFQARRLPPGFFVAGDASGEPFRQVLVAGGDGMKAAMRCAAFLERR